MGLIFWIAFVLAVWVFVIMLALRTLRDQRAVQRARDRLRIGEEEPSRPGRWKAILLGLLEAVRPPAFFDSLLAEGIYHKAGLSIKGKMYQSLWWLLILGGMTLAAVLALVGPLSLLDLVMGLGLILIAGAAPYLYLRWRIQEREREVAKALPDFLDILTFTVEAGLGFMPALRRVSPGTTGVLGDEVNRVLMRVDLGFSRRDALHEMVERLPSADIEHFVEAINLSEQLGTSLARTLRVQANLLRTRRRQRAEVKAQTAPIRIIPALVFFFLPSLLLIYLAPPIINFLIR